MSTVRRVGDCLREFGHQRAPRGATVVLHNLSKRFGSVLAVDDVHLTIESGQFLTVLGPSGSGKTTILKLLAGFETPSAGSIAFDGEDVAWMPPAARNIGMVFQHYALFPHMSVRDNIGYGLKMRGWPKQERQDRIEEMLQLVRLHGMGDRRPRQLSGGQQQRVALARALAFGPRVLLMDEPLGALDKALRLEMGEEIRRIHRETGTTVIYVTHDQEEAMQLSDRVAIMRHGRLVALGTPAELYHHPPSAFVATFFGGCNLLPATCLEATSAGSRVRYRDAEVRLAGPDRLHAGDGVLAVHRHSLRTADGLVDDRDGLVLAARVREVTFMGETTQLTCEVAGDDTLIVRENAPRAATLRPGDGITLFAPADRLIFIPVEQAGSDPDLGRRG